MPECPYSFNGIFIMMNRKELLHICLLLFLTLFTVGGSCAEAREDVPYKRIISLAPAITEILFALGLEKNIAGVTNVCDYPPAAKRKPSVGRMVSPSLETIISLKPDIVLLARNGTQGAFFRKLKEFDIRYYVHKAGTIREVPDGIRSLGDLLGVKKRGEKLAASVENQLRKYSGVLKEKQLKGLFIIWGSPLIVAGKGSLAGEALHLVGIRNIAGDTFVTYPRFSVEEVILRNPDVIFVGLGHNDKLRLTGSLMEKLSSVKALQKGRLFYLSDKLYRPGPRIAEGVKELVERVRGE